ncbi:MAG: heavy metal translocating P-type ATPase [Firmicutes bacterium]|nr:heavy metal translocating P-type ATPase [Bacillota bacterium]
MKTEKFQITGMTCAACQANITRAVTKLDGIGEVNVNLLSHSMTASFDEEKLDPAAIIKTVQGIGYGAALINQGAAASGEKDAFRSQWDARKKQEEDEVRSMKFRLISSIILLIPLMYVSMGHMLGLPLPAAMTGTENALILAFTQLLITIPILFINRKFYSSGLKSLIKRSPNMDSLVAIGSGASLVYGIFAIYRMAWGLGQGDMALVGHYAHELYFESAAMILTLVTIGKFLETRSKAKTSDALGRLLDLAPKTALVVRNGLEQVIPAEQVVAGDVVIIKPGESIPVDGTVIEGWGSVDQAAITGESIPVDKKPGDTVISATINKNGTFRFQASKVGSDTTLSQIIRLVDEAGNTKAPIARLADKVSGIFVPTVILIAIIVGIIWALTGQPFEFALARAITILVISCPCALGLATPVAIMVGTGKAAEYGILIKSAESLENLHNIDTIVMDKTGTLTEGKPAVTDILPFEDTITPSELLRAAAGLEKGSEHPLALAISERAAKDKLETPAAEDFQMHAGRGIQAKLSGALYLGGNPAFMNEQGLFGAGKEAQWIRETSDRLAAQGKTPLLFAREGKLLGIIAAADQVRETSRKAIEEFHQMGIKTVMLTGDNQITAKAIAEELGIHEVIADVLPTEKEACVRKLQEEGRKTAMIGDGINDAPALTRADIGIAIGAGTDIAIESADVVLMKDSLLDVVTAINLSRKVIRNIHVNLFWAFFYNILGIPIAAGALYPAFGLVLNPMIGSAAMSASSVCVVTNALRLRFFKSEQAEDPEEIVTEPQEKLPEEEHTDTTEEKGAITMKKVLTVDGMMCVRCQAHVKKALEAVPGVESVEVDLDKKTAEVTMAEEIADEILVKAVEEEGYTVL